MGLNAAVKGAQAFRNYWAPIPTIHTEVSGKASTLLNLSGTSHGHTAQGKSPKSKSSEAPALRNNLYGTSHSPERRTIPWRADFPKYCFPWLLPTCLWHGVLRDSNAEGPNRSPEHVVGRCT